MDIAACTLALAWCSAAAAQCDSWLPLNKGASDSVLTTLAFNGDLIVGGYFQSAGDQLVNRIARWDGTQWHALRAGMPGVFTDVRALTVFNGDLVAGGFFDSAGGSPAVNIARWNDNAWHAIGDGLPGTGVDALAVFNGQLVASGVFATDSGLANVMRFTGSKWEVIAPETTLGFNDPVVSLIVYEGDLFAGGAFRIVHGQPSAGIARFDGSRWQAVGTELSGAVLATTVMGGELVAAGELFLSDRGSSSEIVMWNPRDGWRSIGNANGTVHALAVNGSDLIAGGSFTAIDQTQAGGIARWNGAQWQPMSEGLTNCCRLPAAVFTIVCPPASLADDIIAGGWFGFGRPDSPLNIARWRGCSPCPGDVTGDQVVNVSDLLAVINAWGFCPNCELIVCPADIAPPGGDCFVNVSDLLAVITAWGPCP